MKTGILMSGILVAVLAFASGCGQQPATPTASQSTVKTDEHDHEQHASTEKPTEEKTESGHDHSGWWCAEHGVPEGQCSQCSSKVAANFQKKGDWCAEHDRAKSQCFLCDPSLKEKFAAQYRAKEGKEPPAIEEAKDVKADKKS